jgi:hypothetical protein
LHNRYGIAVEHGHAINIAMNEIKYNSTAIKLWANEKQGVEASYIQNHNTKSENYWIASNTIEQNKVAYSLKGTDTAVFSGNKKIENVTDWELGDQVSELDSTKESEFLDLDYQKDKRLSPIIDSTIPDQIFPQGIQEIRMSKYGPYNFQYPLIWLKEIDSNQVYHFELLGKAGNWQIKQIKGFEILKQGGDNFPSTILAKSIASSTGKSIHLNYTGPAFMDVFGVLQKSNYLFEYQQ